MPISLKDVDIDIIGESEYLSSNYKTIKKSLETMIDNDVDMSVKSLLMVCKGVKKYTITNGPKTENGLLYIGELFQKTYNEDVIDGCRVSYLIENEIEDDLTIDIPKNSYNSIYFTVESEDADVIFYVNGIKHCGNSCWVYDGKSFDIEVSKEGYITKRVTIDNPSITNNSCYIELESLPAFVFKTVKTNTMHIPFVKGIYKTLDDKDISISWGDGNKTVISYGVFSEEISHVYDKEDEYVIRIKSSNDTMPMWNDETSLISEYNTPFLKVVDFNGNEITTASSASIKSSSTEHITKNIFKNNDITDYSESIHNYSIDKIDISDYINPMGVENVSKFMNVYNKTSDILFGDKCFDGIKANTLSEVVVDFGEETRIHVDSNMFGDNIFNYSNEYDVSNFLVRPNETTKLLGTLPDIWNWKFTDKKGRESTIIGKENFINKTLLHNSRDTLTNVYDIPREWGGFGYYTLTIVPYPSDASVTLKTNHSVQKDNTINVYDGEEVTYIVEKKGFKTKTATITLMADTTLNINL